MGMSENLLIAIIAASSALGGGLVGGLIALWTAKISADREDRRKQEDMTRKAAKERIEKLYEPLLSLMSPGPPYDEFILEPRQWRDVINFLDKNKTYASPELLRIFYEFRQTFYLQSSHIEEADLGYSLFGTTDREHGRLKGILGYGSILKKPSKVRTLLNKLKSLLDSQWREHRIKRIQERRKRRRKTK